MNGNWGMNITTIFVLTSFLIISWLKKKKKKIERAIACPLGFNHGYCANNLLSILTTCPYAIFISYV